MKLSIKLSKQSEAAKAQYIGPFTYCFVLLGIYFALNYYLKYEAKILALSCLGATAAAMTIPLARRYSRSYALVANYVVLIFFTTIQILTIHTGGIKTSSIWWLGITPVLAAFLLNAFYSILWFVLMVVNILVIFYLQNNGFLPVNVIPEVGKEQFLMTSTIFGITLLTALCALSDMLREKISSEKDKLQGEAFRLTQLASLGNLAAGVSHEINNPLAVIRGAQLKIRRMLEGDEDIDKKALKNYMQKIERSTRRIHDVTASMRTLSTDSDAKLTTINIQELVEAIARTCRDRIGTRDIQVKTVIRQRDLYFTGFYKEIYRAFFNVVLNAMDELIDLNRGNGEIELILDAQGDDILVYIKDNGRGIPPEVEPYIFDPFFSTKLVGRATGLGLTFSQNVFSYNGGRLELYPSKQGACFKITLPVVSEK